MSNFCGVNRYRWNLWKWWMETWRQWFYTSNVFSVFSFLIFGVLKPLAAWELLRTSMMATHGNTQYPIRIHSTHLLFVHVSCPYKSTMCSLAQTPNSHLLPKQGVNVPIRNIFIVREWSAGMNTNKLGQCQGDQSQEAICLEKLQSDQVFSAGSRSSTGLAFHILEIPSEKGYEWGYP